MVISNEMFFLIDEKGKKLSYKLLNDNENFILRANGTLEVRKLAYKHEKFILDVIAIDNGVKPDISMYYNYTAN